MFQGKDKNLLFENTRESEMTCFSKMKRELVKG